MIATPKPCLPPDASASDDRAPLQTPRSARLNDDLGAILSARRERLEKKEAEGRRVSFSNKPSERWADVAHTYDDFATSSTRSSSPDAFGPVSLSSRGVRRLSLPAQRSRPRRHEKPANGTAISQDEHESDEPTPELIRSEVSPMGFRRHRTFVPQLPARSMSAADMRNKRDAARMVIQTSMAPVFEDDELIESSDEEEEVKQKTPTNSKSNSAPGWSLGSFSGGSSMLGTFGRFAKEVGSEIASISSELSGEARQAASGFGKHLNTAKYIQFEPFSAFSTSFKHLHDSSNRIKPNSHLVHLMGV
jgi:hypothetical protein